MALSQVQRVRSVAFWSVTRKCSESARTGAQASQLREFEPFDSLISLKENEVNTYIMFCHQRGRAYTATHARL